MNDHDDPATGGAPAGVLPRPGAVVPRTEHPGAAGQLQDIDDALAGLPALPIDAQVAVFTELHQRLTAALAVTATAAGSTDDQPRHDQPRHDQQRRDQPRHDQQRNRPGQSSLRSR
jgi:hypothetical protein